MMRILGFAGTAKNTGKTTTALHILDLVHSQGYAVALTSIGYDGENTDHITGLPKPKYFAVPGMMIATAEQCLQYCSAGYDIVQRTGIHTILGEIVIAAVTSQGNMVLAGPNRRIDIYPLIQQLSDRGIEILFLDGALNRLAAMTMVDELILSTGAALDHRIPFIANHAQAMESLFHHSKYAGSAVLEENAVCYFNAKGERQTLLFNSILDDGSMKQAASWITENGSGTLYIPGIMDPKLFSSLVHHLQNRLSENEFVFSTPLHILTTGQPDLWKTNFETVLNHGCRVSYKTPIRLALITVNPFYPKYLQKTASYIAEFVDKQELLSSVREKISATQVVDILQPPYPDLLSLCHLEKRS